MKSIMPLSDSLCPCQTISISKKRLETAIFRSKRSKIPKMAFQDDDDDMIFVMPTEEDEEITTTGENEVETEGGGDFANDESSAISSPSLTPIANRLIYKHQNTAAKRSNGGNGPKFLDESQKVAYVEILLAKLAELDSFEEAEVSLPYWRTLTFLCSENEDSNSASIMAFVRNGGVGLIERNLHDFMVCSQMPGDGSDFKVAIEILNCLMAISASAAFVNVDTESIIDYLGSLIELDERKFPFPRRTFSFSVLVHFRSASETG